MLNIFMVMALLFICPVVSIAREEKFIEITRPAETIRIPEEQARQGLERLIAAKQNALDAAAAYQKEIDSLYSAGVTLQEANWSDIDVPSEGVNWNDISTPKHGVNW